MRIFSWLREVPFLEHVEQGKANNLNLIRLVAAALVILSHCYVLLDAFDSEPMQVLLRFGDLGGTAVFVFFFVSGYLILKSGLRSSAIGFIQARALRIFPALVIVVCLSALLLGPLVSRLPTIDYFTDGTTYAYLWQAVLHANPGVLPGVFSDGRAVSTINQPLWTLASEWLAYTVVLIVCVIGRAVRNHERPAWKVVFLLVATALFTVQTFPLPWLHALSWFAFFTLGSVLYILRKWVPLSVLAAIVVLALDLALIRVLPPLGKAAFPLALSYAVLVAGFHPSLHFSGFHRIGDYSYGLYIFGWPVQQLMLPFAQESPIRLFALAMPFTLVLAITSWHLIEKPALSLKSRSS